MPNIFVHFLTKPGINLKLDLNVIYVVFLLPIHLMKGFAKKVMILKKKWFAMEQNIKADINPGFQAAKRAETISVFGWR